MSSEDDARLLSAFRDAAGERGVVIKEAAFIGTKELSVRWKREGDALVLYISDYLRDAPAPVLKDFCLSALAFAFGGSRGLGKAFMEYMTSDAFLREKRPVYLRRSKNLLLSDVGQTYALSDSVQRLYDAGLLRGPDIENTVFTWTVRPNRTRLGYCSRLMRVVAISSALDSPGVSEHTLDYVVYHECMHLRQGYRPFDRRPHDAGFRRDMSLFPDPDAAERELAEIAAGRPGKRRPRTDRV